ncbi:hypothetical protein GF314_07385 [bacterium]|nr:hypothetical protein [bacterium]
MTPSMSAITARYGFGDGIGPSFGIAGERSGAVGMARAPLDLTHKSGGHRSQLGRASASTPGLSVVAKAPRRRGGGPHCRWPPRGRGSRCETMTAGPDAGGPRRCSTVDLSISPAEIALRLVLAIVFGGLVGFEREYKMKSAGLRTHMMVALGAATFTLVAMELFARISATSADVAARVDPMRLVQGIIGGIGFLGAGSIIQARGRVAGLTTAGSLWFVGSVGMAAGAGYYVLALLAVTAGVLVLAGFALLERHLPQRDDPPEIDQ